MGPLRLSPPGAARPGPGSPPRGYRGTGGRSSATVDYAMPVRNFSAPILSAVDVEQRREDLDLVAGTAQAPPWGRHHTTTADTSGPGLGRFRRPRHLPLRVAAGAARRGGIVKRPKGKCTHASQAGFPAYTVAGEAGVTTARRSRDPCSRG